MELNIGIAGAGNFSRFAANAFIKVEGINVIAVADINDVAADQMAKEFDAIAYTDYETLLKDKKIDLVYIATPPFLHFQHSKMALSSGKHVICEKPAALRVKEVEELVTIAASLKLLYVVNLMQRYNPLYAVVKKIVDQKILGNFLHGFFENYASDENLSPQHWFWDQSKSGGIFIEHGVHFFDMFSGWLGEGELVSAVELQRPCVENKIIDRVQATVAYDKGIVNFYHGFDQPKILDRQEMRLQFERGEITLYEWIPVRMRLHGLLQKEQLNKLQELLGRFEIVHHSDISMTDQKVKGRFTDIVFDEHVTIDYGNNADKQNRYEHMITAMINDQWNWIKDRNHCRMVDESNAVQSLQMAEKAQSTATKM